MIFFFRPGCFEKEKKRTCCIFMVFTTEFFFKAFKAFLFLRRVIVNRMTLMLKAKQMFLKSFCDKKI